MVMFDAITLNYVIFIYPFDRIYIMNVVWLLFLFSLSLHIVWNSNEIYSKSDEIGSWLPCEDDDDVLYGLFESLWAAANR